MIDNDKPEAEQPPESDPAFIEAVSILLRTPPKPHADTRPKQRSQERDREFGIKRRGRPKKAAD